MVALSCDLLVIGSGIAGLTVALKASDQADVILCTKGTLRDTNTGLAQGGIAVAMSDSDKPLYHYEDTIKAGAHLCEPESVSVLVQDGPVRVRELIRRGASFDRAQNDFSLTREGAHRQRRILHAGDSTGLEIERTLLAGISGKKNIAVCENVFIKDLIVHRGVCRGAVGIQVHTGEIQLIQAQAVILCSGGLGQVYARNTNPPLATGDGTAMAYRAGAALSDMEFVQFHPTTLVTGDRKPVSLFLISEAVRGEGAHLLNAYGHRFMPDYYPEAELAPRDIVARAIVEEMHSTGVHHVFLDFTGIREDVARRFPNIFRRCQEQGYDITRDYVPVAPAAHYAMGGVLSDVNGATTVRGLYAAGEVSSVGVHGANRLASNSLLDGLVFGYRAAEAAVSYIRTVQRIPVSADVSGAARTLSVQELADLREQIRDTMWNYVGIVRTGQGLKTALKTLTSIARKLNFMTTDYHVSELQNILQNALLITSFALERTESRGAHYRKDYPQADPSWRKRLVTSRESAEKIPD